MMQQSIMQSIFFMLRFDFSFQIGLCMCRNQGNLPFKIPIVCSETTLTLPKIVLNRSCSGDKVLPMGHLNDDTINH